MTSLSNVADTLACLIRMRNDVAHPKRTRLGMWSTYEWAEAGFFAMHMFDLTMLWWLGYGGRYMPRTAEFRAYDDSVQVPWT